MKIPALALFSRSLRLEARALTTYGLRTGLLLLMLVTLFAIERTARYGMLGAPGLKLFAALVTINFWFISLVGLVYFASAITEEKEEMTLGLLRMTRLSPVAILLGKSTSRLCGAAMLLVIQLPFTLLAVTLGGVATHQILAAGVALFAYVFMLSNLALFNSVVFQRTRTAAAITAVMLLALVWGPRALMGLVSLFAESYQWDLASGGWPRVTAVLEWFADASPLRRVGAVLSTGFNEPLFDFHFWSNLAIGAVLFLAAWAVFDLCTRQQKDDAPSRGIGLWTFARRRQRPAGKLPAWALRGNAVMWKDFVVLGGGWRGVLLKLAAFGVTSFGFIYLFSHIADESMQREWVGWSIVVTSLVVTALMLGIDASRVFQKEIRWKTLSALMIVPLSLREIAYRKVAGCVLGSLPFLVWTVIGFLVLPDSLVKLLEMVWDIDGDAVIFISMMLLNYLLFLHLVAFLSLILKHGAFLAGIAIHYVGGSFLMLPIGIMASLVGLDVEAVLFLAFVTIAILIVILHLAIGRRLRLLMSRD